VKNPFERLDKEELRHRFLAAKPVHWIKIDGFLPEADARAVAEGYPEFDAALQIGRAFRSVNERKKIQITDSSKFAPAVAELHQVLASPQFLSDLAYITDMPDLLADDQLVGGGIHITGPGGRLDVHVDFNYLEDRKLHRRLNLLIYLNDPWREEWGGQFQLYDAEVRSCEATFAPIFNRCVIFETNEVSFHGVIPVSPAAPNPRRSFATYYYTREAPAHWSGVAHSTIFKARTEERMKGMILMPADRAKQTVLEQVRIAKRGLRRIFARQI